MISKYPDMKIVKSQSGDFTRAKGKEVMESFLKSPEAKQINALYAHNDDMALGAIQAMEEAGLKPGKDITIVSIDGVAGAFEAMVAGKFNCTVECNPLIGPQLFDAVEAISEETAETNRRPGGRFRAIPGSRRFAQAQILTVPRVSRMEMQRPRRCWKYALSPKFPRRPCPSGVDFTVRRAKCTRSWAKTGRAKAP